MILLALLDTLFAFPQPAASTPASAKQSPVFENYPVSELWHGTTAPLKLSTRSERMFRTNLTNATKEPPNFASHYRFTFWGCGSLCGAGAVVDLQSGLVYPPPLEANGNGWEHWIISPAFFDGSGVDFRPDSRLVIVRAGINYSERLQKNVPDVYYFVWEGTRFRQIFFVSGKQSRHGQ
ncbi:MAG TPA: hypothetical protein VEU96_10080 [Bryobacteraceae bacterium]|nr:hypothetical protein [Bryobacteraceae bacterium]